jgi:hypothetical protein
MSRGLFADNKKEGRREPGGPGGSPPPGPHRLATPWVGGGSSFAPYKSGESVARTSVRPVPGSSQRRLRLLTLELESEVAFAHGSPGKELGTRYWRKFGAPPAAALVPNLPVLSLERDPFQLLLRHRGHSVTIRTT